MQQPISAAGVNDGQEGGFTLLEVVCVIGILAILAAVVIPLFPRGTSRAQLEAYALATAALLKTDRAAALRRRTEVITEINAVGRVIRSGTTGHDVRIPEDVTIDALLPIRCGPHKELFRIRFFSTGMSCGGVISLSRLGVSYDVRVNWLTGGVDVVAVNRT